MSGDTSYDSHRHSRGGSQLATGIGKLRSLTQVRLQQLPGLDLAPLASLPQLRELTLMDMNESVDLSPFAQTDHRLRVELRNTLTVGEPGPLVKIRRR